MVSIWKYENLMHLLTLCVTEWTVLLIWFDWIRQKIWRVCLFEKHWCRRKCNYITADGLAQSRTLEIRSMPSEDMQSGRLVRKCEVVPTPPASEIWAHYLQQRYSLCCSKHFWFILDFLSSRAKSFIDVYLRLNKHKTRQREESH